MYTTKDDIYPIVELCTWYQTVLGHIKQNDRWLLHSQETNEISEY
jgi:hypothetical protein